MTSKRCSVKCFNSTFNVWISSRLNYLRAEWVFFSCWCCYSRNVLRDHYRGVFPLLNETNYNSTGLFSITTNAALHSSILRSLRITLCMPARSHKFIFTLYWLFHKTIKRARKKVGAGFAQCVKMLWLCQLMT